MLDLSYNRIKKIEGLESLVKVKKLFLSSNKISKIEGLNHFKNLDLLELGDNKLRVRLFDFSIFMYFTLVLLF